MHTCIHMMEKWWEWFSPPLPPPPLPSPLPRVSHYFVPFFLLKSSRLQACSANSWPSLLWSGFLSDPRAWCAVSIWQARGGGSFYGIIELKPTLHHIYCSGSTCSMSPGAQCPSWPLRSRPPLRKSSMLCFPGWLSIRPVFPCPLRSVWGTAWASSLRWISCLLVRAMRTKTMTRMVDSAKVPSTKLCQG